jgi:hypothetical protein
VLRLAVNLLAALWIASAAWQATGAVRCIGLFVAVDFALYSFLGLPFAWAFFITLPSLVLLPVWFVLIGRLLAKESGHTAPQTTAKSQPATSANELA